MSPAEWKRLVWFAFGCAFVAGFAAAILLFNLSD